MTWIIDETLFQKIECETDENSKCKEKACQCDAEFINALRSLMTSTYARTGKFNCPGADPGCANGILIYNLFKVTLVFVLERTFYWSINQITWNTLIDEYYHEQNYCKKYDKYRSQNCREGNTYREYLNNKLLYKFGFKYSN